MKLKLVSKQPVTSDVVSFVFEPDQPVDVRPGQYFHYVLPHPETDDRGTERWFTNSAAPSEAHVMISTRLAGEEGSSFKRALDQLAIGDIIYADGPEGGFVVDDVTRQYIFVAGGIGITPFRAILTEAKEKGTQIKAKLLYANRSDDIPFKDELEAIAEEQPDVTIDYIISPDTIDSELIKRYADETESPLIYLSGPEPMVKDLAAQLGNLGVSDDNIKLDDFPGYEAI